jgi:hypothetical protein
MKMAIIGSGPIAILTAKHFDEMGAEVVLFQRSPLGGNIRFLLDKFPSLEITYKNEKIQINDFFEKIIIPAVVSLENLNLTKRGDVQRVHKRFLHPDEDVPGRTRMHDLYRVIYSQNPKEAILKQLAENPEFFNQLGEEVIKSLHLPVESFEDFDVVIEATGLGKSNKPIGAGGSFALNENNLKESSLILYGKEIFEKLDLTNKKTIVIVGEGLTLKLALLKFQNWLLNTPGNSLHWVTYKKLDEPCGNEGLDLLVANFIKEVAIKYDSAKIDFEKKKCTTGAILKIM